MTAARTKQHEEKNTGVRAEKKEKIKKQDQKQENRTQGVDSNKASCLCYKAEPGTMPPDLPTSSYSAVLLQVYLTQQPTLRKVVSYCTLL